MKYITVSSELERTVQYKVDATIDICRNEYSLDIPTPTIRFRQLGRRAGICRFNFHTKTSEIVINPDFFKNYYDDMLNDTVPHEVAHHVSAYVHGREGYNHGWLWKGVMRKLGIPAADRCHEYSLEGVKIRQVTKPYHYGCGCDVKHVFTKSKHTKAQFYVEKYGRTGYTCRRCRKPLIYQGFTQNGIFIPFKKREPVVAAPIRIVEVFTISTPPLTVTEPDTKFRTVTRFVNGMLTNVKVPLEA